MKAQGRMVGELARQLSPDMDGSMSNRTVRDINTCVQTSIEGVLVQVRDIQDKLETPRAAQPKP